MEMNELRDEERGKTIEILRIIVDEYTMFQKSKDNKERLNHLMEVLMFFILYIVQRYNYGNYLKLKEKREDTENDER